MTNARTFNAIDRQADTRRKMEARAVGTGRKAQRARRWLRDNTGEKNDPVKP